MLKTKTLILLLVILFPFAAFSQKNYLPGYIIKNDGTKDSGMINYRNWDINPSVIQFRPSGKTDVSLTPNEISAFEIIGYDRYVKAIVNVDMRSVDFTNLDPKDDNRNRLDTVFLRVVVKGNPLSLFEFIDAKDHYYFQNGEGKIEELRYRIFQTTRDSSRQLMYDNAVSLKSFSLVQTDYGFRIQLLNAVNYKVDKRQQETLQAAEYRESDLKKFIVSVNASNDYGVKKLKSEVKSSFFLAGGGLAIQSLKFTEEVIANYSDLVFNQSVTPLIGMGFDFTPGRNMQKTIIRLELTYYTLNSQATYTQQSAIIKYKIRQHNIMPSFSILYNFLGVKKVSFYGGGSFGVNFSTYPVNEYTSTIPSSGNVYNLEPLSRFKNWAAIHAKGGLIINKKIDIGISALVDGGSINSTSVAEGGTRLLFKVLYRF